MQASQLGVLREDPHEDMRLLLENYTAAALASALRDREDTLQLCADLLSNNRIDELSKILRPYEPKFIHQRRHSRGKVLDFSKGGFSQEIIELLRKGLNRMPRRVSTAHSKRAGVVLPLCNVEGVPCILFEKRSRHLRAHADEVCLPGGMVSEGGDKSIVQTCLREMEEEIGIEPAAATVLGVLRCNWGEVCCFFCYTTADSGAEAASDPCTSLGASLSWSCSDPSCLLHRRSWNVTIEPKSK
eukprot:CCRYP_013593-RA/>CCRYP_013593-RA protein AED:0.02 eAED:0.02 QI:683/1/1/1/0.5/0.33/3/314/242